MSRHPSLEEIEARFRDREDRQRSSDSPVPAPRESTAPVVPTPVAVHEPEDAAPALPDTTGVDAVPVAEDDPQATIAELREKLRAEQHAKAAIQGRLAPTQQDLGNLRQVLTLSQQREAELEAEAQALRQQLEARDSTDAQANIRQAVLDALTEEERAEYDEGFIEVVSRVSQTVNQRMQPSLDVEAEVARALKKAEDERLQEYRSQIITDPNSVLSNLHTVSATPEFKSWLQQNPDLEYHLNGLAFSRTTKDINKFAKSTERHLKAFFDHIDNPAPSSGTEAVQRTADPTPAGVTLESAMDRRQSGPRSAQDEARLQKQIADLSRSRDPDDRAKALELINQL